METNASIYAPNRSPGLPALTGARFFAAIYVVFYHFLYPNLHTPFWPLLNFLSVGYSAVGFFFVLSGFVLTYSYSRADGTLRTGRLQFWKARFRRIYPAYLLAFLIAAPFQIWGSLQVNTLRLAIAKLAFGGTVFLTLLQAWTPWTAWYWNIPAWSLSVEAFFYLCFPLAIVILTRISIRRCLLAAIGVWLLGLMGPLVYCLLLPVAAQPPFAMAQLAVETNPLMRLPEFLVGLLLARLFLSGLRLRFAGALSLASVLALLLSLLLCAGLPRLLLSNGLVSPISALLIFTLAHSSGVLAKLLSLRAIQILGEASYGIYIFQYPVSYVLHLNDRTFTPALFSEFLVVLIAISLASFFLLEPWLRGLFRGATKTTSTSVATHSVMEAPST